ncbi:hypothetical protein WMF31_04705 [Sorangium sp. So ce1036]|uniref:hypothetical protein n=1 Tax=Sorangium sp. So ce1036 TaxID=3133328 RepID=UPI003EFE799A
MPGASGRAWGVLVLLSSGGAAAGCDAASADLPPGEAGAPGGAATGPGSAPPGACALPRGFSRGAPARFPAMSSPVLGHRLSGAPDGDVFGLYLRSTVAFCGPDEAPYFLRYRFYLTGPLAGRWLRPPLVQPI